MKPKASTACTLQSVLEEPSPGGKEHRQAHGARKASRGSPGWRAANDASGSTAACTSTSHPDADDVPEKKVKRWAVRRGINARGALHGSADSATEHQLPVDPTATILQRIAQQTEEIKDVEGLQPKALLERIAQQSDWIKVSMAEERSRLADRAAAQRAALAEAAKARDAARRQSLEASIAAGRLTRPQPRFEEQTQPHGNVGTYTAAAHGMVMADTHTRSGNSVNGALDMGHLHGAGYESNNTGLFPKSMYQQKLRPFVDTPFNRIFWAETPLKLREVSVSHAPPHCVVYGNVCPAHLRMRLTSMLYLIMISSYHTVWQT